MKCPGVMKWTKTNHSSHSTTTKWGQSEKPQAVDRNFSQIQHHKMHIWNKTWNNLLCLWNQLHFIWSPNAQTALLATLCQILNTHDATGYLKCSIKAFVSVQSSLNSTLGFWEVQKDPSFLLLFGVLFSKLLLEWLPRDNCQNHRPMNTHNDILSVII